MKKFISKLYILGLMALTVLFIILIWNVTFSHIIEEYHQRKIVTGIAKDRDQQKKKNEELTFQKIILEGDETVKHYLGYRVLKEIRIEGHFHHIDLDLGPDRRNYCIECHGDIPHDKVKDIRAFGNMHASFIACQTCHIKLEGPVKSGVFKWYDRSTGDIVASPVREAVQPGTYKAKILPFERVDGDLQRIDTAAKIAFAREFKEKENALTEVQKSKAKKIIHKQVSEKPYSCEDCHRKQAPVLPFEDLGYPKHRIDAIVSTEVIGMIKNYTEFYIPRILEPGFGQKQLFH